MTIKPAFFRPPEGMVKEDDDESDEARMYFLKPIFSASSPNTRYFSLLWSLERELGRFNHKQDTSNHHEGIQQSHEEMNHLLTTFIHRASAIQWMPLLRSKRRV